MVNLSKVATGQVLSPSLCYLLFRGRHHWQEVGEAFQGGQTDVVARVAVGGAGGRATVVSVAATAGTKSKHKT